MIVRVAGYEEDVKGGVEQTSPIRMQERQGRTEVQLDQRTVTMDQQRVQSNRDKQGDLVVVQEVRTEVDMDPGHGNETSLTECTSSQFFQAKLDEIDGELSRFDRVEDGSDSLQGGAGSRMMGSAIFLKNLFTQEKSSSPTPSPSKFTRIPRQSGMVLDPLGVVLSKRSR